MAQIAKLRHKYLNRATFCTPINDKLKLINVQTAFMAALDTNVLVGLLSATELSIDSEAALEIALSLYKKHTADFADCVHLALAHMAGERPLWTFDKAASKVEGARLLAL